MIDMTQENNFLSNKFSHGLIIRADYETIQAIKKHISQYDDKKIIFQKISTNKLWIKEGGKDE